MQAREAWMCRATVEESVALLPFDVQMRSTGPIASKCYTDQPFSEAPSRSATTQEGWVLAPSEEGILWQPVYNQCRV